MKKNKLNLGCGFEKLPGYINVDSAVACEPDVVWDLETFPWPFEDNSVVEIRMKHVLEHIGVTTESYLSIWKEMYRICEHGALIDITVPHFRHENFFHDPTHVRAITPIGIAMFDQSRNKQYLENGGSETKLGMILGIDLELYDADIEYVYTREIIEAVARGEISKESLSYITTHQNNIIIETRIRPHIVKPARETKWLRDYKKNFTDTAFKNEPLTTQDVASSLTLSEVYALEQWGEFDNAYHELQNMPADTHGLPAKIGWHKILHGDFKNGYPLLHTEIDEWRPEYTYSLRLEKELTQNTPLTGAKIFIVPEGGLGDEIIGARFVELYKKQGAYVILGASQSLHTVFSRLPIPPDEIRSPQEVTSSEYDFWAGSLRGPIYLNLNNPREGMTLPYLTAREDVVTKWKSTIDTEAHGKLKIGIRWQGKQPEGTNALRVESIPLQALLQLREIGQVFSFQQERAIEELSNYPDIYDLGSQLSSWEDTLACMSEMDVMVTCCTSTAHAAGALGINTCVITTMNPYFTWIGGDGDKSLWYESVQIFKQPQFGAWQEAVTQAKEYIVSLKKEIPITTENPQMLFNQALKAGEQGEHDKAASLYRQALSLITEKNELYHMIRYNLNWYEFRDGNLDKGFLYRIESGRELGFIIRPQHIYEKPYLTSATNIVGKIILLSSECGVGDDILNARYAKILKAKGAAKVIWAADKGLETVFIRIDGIDVAIRHDEVAYTEFDFWVLTLELPLILNPTIAEISIAPYITASPTYTTKWREKLVNKEGLKVGIRWKGEINRDHSQKRSLPLPYLERLLNIDGVVTYSLQRDFGIEDLQQNSSIINWGKDLETWEDTIAALNELDLVITSDTSIAHAAAALGKETWVVVRPFSYFAWIPTADNTSVWYPSVKIFREPILSNWEVPFAKMEMELNTKLQKNTSANSSTHINAEFPHGILKMNIHKETELVSEILRKQNWYSQGDLKLYDILLSKGDLYIDGGANIGWYSLYAAEKVGKEGHVLAIEPDEKNFKVLCENIELNELSQISPLQVALGKEKTKGRLYSSPFNFGDHFVMQDGLQTTQNRESVEVQITTLDTLLQKYNQTPKLIKLDIQGAEMKALSGAQTLLTYEQKPFILLEFAPGLMLREGSSPFELFAFIEKNFYFPLRVFDDYSGHSLLEQISIDELLEFTKQNRNTEIGWDILLVHKDADKTLLEKITQATA